MNRSAIVIDALLIIILLYAHNLFAQEIPKVGYTSYDLRDPLENPLEVEVEEAIAIPSELDISLPEGLVVRGIVWGVEPVRAIINDEVVGKGDTILDARVLDVRKEGVYLLYKGRRFIIRPQ